MKRRLAAVLCADMVGYSRLVEREEEQILARQKALRAELIDPEIARNHGRIVKTLGDGVLVEFPSALEAVRCAIDIQTEMSAREAGRDEASRIRYRIGINLGDVIIDSDDIFGDGVNVAARLQGLAEPGGICISDTVQQIVLDRVGAPFRDLGGQRVKNISRIVRVWQWVPDAPVEPPVSDIALRQRVQFCSSSDGTQIAYADIGDGYPIVRAPHWQSHIELEWRSPFRRAFLNELAQQYRVIRFDQRGTGLSDWDAERISIDAMVDDIEAVTAAVGLKRFALLGLSQGAGFAIRYATEHPEEVTCLILYGGYLRGRMVREDPEAEKFGRIGRMMIAEGWGLPDPTYRNFFTSSMIPNAPPEVIESFDEMQRLSSSPEVATRIFEMNGAFDLEAFARQINVPTLVMHATGDRMVPVESSQRIAQLIPGAHFVELPGENHILLEQEEGFSIFFEEMRRFIEEMENTG